jgi:glycogen debranching enzyme
VIAFCPAPASLSAQAAVFETVVFAHGRTDIFVEVGIEPADPLSQARFRAASARARYGMRSSRRRGATVSSSGRVFNEWLGKSRADLALLTTELATGPYPYAGIPWFSTAFGRDAVITALQMLWLDPTLAQGILRFLAAHQATEILHFADAAPGKIMHETRKGEMARLQELPFGRYYGGVNTTPLFVVLAGVYAGRTGDLALIGTLWPSLLAAMAWIEGECDSDGDADSLTTPARPRRGSRTRAGRTARIRCSTRTAARPQARSPWSRCRTTPTQRSVPWPISPGGGASPRKAAAGR